MQKSDVLPLIKSAKDLVNGNPNNIARDFIIVDKDGLSDDDTDIFGKVPLHTNIHNSLAQEILNKLTSLEKRIENKKKTVSGFSVENVNKETTPLQVIDKSDIPKYSRYEYAIKGTVMGEMDFEGNDDIAFQIVRTQNEDGETFAALRRFTSRQMVGQNWKIKVSLRNNEYNEFEDSIIGLPKKFDAYYYDDKFFVQNQSAFESIFDYFEAYEEKADKVFEFLRNSGVTIHNLEEIESSIRCDNRSLRKMNRISNIGLYQDINLEQAKKKIDEYDLGINIETVDGQRGIHVPDLRKKYVLLAIFNDDLLTSNTTGSRYLVDGKERRSG